MDRSWMIDNRCISFVITKWPMHKFEENCSLSVDLISSSSFICLFIYFLLCIIYIERERHTHTIVHVGQHPSCSIYINNLAKRHSMYHKVLHEQVQAAHLSHQSIRSDSFSVKIQYSNIWQGLDKLEWQPAWDIYMVINMQFKKSTFWILWK